MEIKTINCVLNILIIIAILLGIFLMVYMLWHGAFSMALLKDECIKECQEINKLNPYSCAC